MNEIWLVEEAAVSHISPCFGKGSGLKPVMNNVGYLE